MAAFRSVVIPLVSAGLTLLSTGAAYGVIVAVFQWGWLGGGIDIGTTAPDRPVDPADAVHLPLRALHGLPGVPPLPDPGRMARPAQRHRRRRRARSPDGSSPPPRPSWSASSGRSCSATSGSSTSSGSASRWRCSSTPPWCAGGVPAMLQLIGRANWWFPSGSIASSLDFLAESPALATTHHQPRPITTLQKEHLKVLVIGHLTGKDIRPAPGSRRPPGRRTPCGRTHQGRIPQGGPERPSPAPQRHRRRRRAEHGSPRLPFVKHDLVTFDYIELEDTSPS